jgi:hypothetical protein
MYNNKQIVNYWKDSLNQAGLPKPEQSIRWEGYGFKVKTLL